MQFRWSLAPPQPLLCAELQKRLGISGLLSQCLLNRGHSDPALAEEFLEPRLKRLADPFLISGMRAAVDRLFLARQRREPIVIFGDYDVDGITSVALLMELLPRLGWRAQPYLPHRLEEGYGLSSEAVENCLRKHPASLLLAVDCGSTAGAVIESLRSRGIETIVVDHHQISAPPPLPAALVNPQAEPPETRRFAELCSAGLSFKLAHAVLKRARELNLPRAQDIDLRPFLDLVALGSIADLVPLTGENRVLVSAGLARLDATERIGLKALKEVASISGPVGVHEVGFQLAPRLNAAGRLETASAALHLLLSEDPLEATSLANELDAQNRRRQDIEQSIAGDAISSIRSRFDPARDYVLVEGQLLWHVGVVGIVASRVMREFYRPAIIVGGEGAEWRGSGRSIQGFDLAAALRECDDLLARHGGHAMAAGLTIHCDNLPRLRDRLNEAARRALTPEMLKPELRIDGEAFLSQLNLAGTQELERLNPVGQGNPAVQLMARNLRLKGAPQRIGKTKNHLKFLVTDGRATAEAVWWNAPADAALPSAFDLAFVPQIRAFQGQQFVQLKLLDWRKSL